MIIITIRQAAAQLSHRSWIFIFMRARAFPERTLWIRLKRSSADSTLATIRRWITTALSALISLGLFLTFRPPPPHPPYLHRSHYVHLTLMLCRLSALCGTRMITFIPLIELCAAFIWRLTSKPNPLGDTLLVKCMPLGMEMYIYIYITSLIAIPP